METLPYSTQWIDEDDIAAVERVLRSGWLTTGPAVEQFESALAAATGARHAVAVNTGTAALHTAYAAAGLGPGDEIVTTPLTFVATASAALMLGATVRFADIDPTTGNLDPARVADLVNERTRLITAVDFAGHPADYAALRDAGGRRAPLLIADAAHSLGASADGTPVGSLADITCLSFHPVKSMTTAEGGAVLTGSDSIDKAARRFRNHGIVRDPDELVRPGAGWYYEVQSLGMNYRLPDILCALGISQLRRLEPFVARRRAIAGAYAQALSDIDALELPAEQAGVRSSWHLYVVRVRDGRRRDAFYDALRREGLLVQVHYLPVYRHPYFERLGYAAGQCPVADDFSGRALSLPLYPKMTDDEVGRVVDTVRRVARTVL